jgi:hypothetical protein
MITRTRGFNSDVKLLPPSVTVIIGGSTGTFFLLPYVFSNFRNVAEELSSWLGFLLLPPVIPGS